MQSDGNLIQSCSTTDKEMKHWAHQNTAECQQQCVCRKKAGVCVPPNNYSQTGKRGKGEKPEVVLKRDHILPPSKDRLPFVS